MKYKVLRMGKIRKICWMVGVLMVVLCSCSSSKQTYKKRRKMAPCNCPVFTFTPQTDGDFTLNSSFSIHNS